MRNDWAFLLQRKKRDSSVVLVRHGISYPAGKITTMKAAFYTSWKSLFFVSSKQINEQKIIIYLCGSLVFLLYSNIDLPTSGDHPKMSLFNSENKYAS